MTRITYGIASSAFHSTRSLVEVANRCPDQSLENSIKQDFYADDYVSGAESIPDARSKVEQICQEHKNHGFELRKLISSHHEIISSLPEAQSEITDQKTFMDKNYKIKTLGISWMPNTDIFCFRRISTRKQISLSEICCRQNGLPPPNRSKHVIWT